MPRPVKIGICALLIFQTVLVAKPPRKIKPGANPPQYIAFSKRLNQTEQVQHALERLTFGPKPGDIQRVRELGLKRWLDFQLHPEKHPENPLLETRLLPLESLRMSIEETYRHYPPPQLMRGPNVVERELSEGKLLRAISSDRQLQELLVDFWFNHFNVFENKGADRYLIGTYEREAIRSHVFGKFYDLLLATAQSPAMLFYLDNWQSAAPARARQTAKVGMRKNTRGLNENYGRELLELHTLGVNGGYTQQDVIAVARGFTGWTIARPHKDGSFEYNDRMHDKGEKLVLGHVIPAGGGMNDGLEVLRILAHHPATAQHISLQIAQRFVADDPPPSLVHRMTETFLETDGDLRQVVSVMVHSPEFWSQGAYHAKIKTPFELVVSAVRATNADVTSALPLSNELRTLGEPLYEKIEPTGYSNSNPEWVSSAALLERMNFALALTHNRMPGVKMDATVWSTRGATDPLSIARSLLGQEPSGPTRSAIEKTISENAESGLPAPPSVIAALALGSPEFQKK